MRCVQISSEFSERHLKRLFCHNPLVLKMVLPLSLRGGHPVTSKDLKPSEHGIVSVCFWETKEGIPETLLLHALTSLFSPWRIRKSFRSSFYSDFLLRWCLFVSCYCPERHWSLALRPRSQHRVPHHNIDMRKQNASEVQRSGHESTIEDGNDAHAIESRPLFYFSKSYRPCSPHWKKNS